MMLPSLCLSCSRREPTRNEMGTPTVLRCAAYPGGIPAEIARGADHRARRGDEVGGLVYAQVDTDEARLAFDAWRAFSTS